MVGFQISRIPVSPAARRGMRHEILIVPFHTITGLDDDPGRLIFKVGDPDLMDHTGGDAEVRARQDGEGQCPRHPGQKIAAAQCFIRECFMALPSFRALTIISAWPSWTLKIFRPAPNNALTSALSILGMKVYSTSLLTAL